MIIGVDLGNVNVKTSEINIKTDEHVLFSSKICKDQKTLELRKPTDENYFTFNSESCLVGEGDFQTDPNKLDKELYKTCFLTALARSTAKNYEEFQIVTGLPASHFIQKNKDKIKEILKDRFYTVELGGEKKTLIIKNLEVFPECAAPMFGMTIEQKLQVKNSDLIIVNMGGGNTNIAYFKQLNWKRTLTKSSTVMNGSLNLYSDFINAVNGEYSLNKSIEDAEDILVNGLEIYGEKQSLSFTKEIIQEHVDKIFKELNLYPVKSSRVMFTGGACRTLKPVIQIRLKNCIFQSNYLTATAEGLKKVGVALWQKDCR